MAKYTYFFRTESPFSNFHPSPFKWRGIPFNCNEQYYMYRKAIHFNDVDTARRIMAETEPRAQKHLGRQVDNYKDEEWKKVCRVIMKTGLMCKFDQNAELKQKLKDSKGVLVEASPWDGYWGIACSATDPRAATCSTWPGQNHLGYLLTEVRDTFLSGSRGEYRDC